MLMRNGGQGGVVGSSPPFDSSLAEREISYLNSAAEALDWKAPNGSTFSLEIPPTVYPPRRDTDLLAEVLCRGPLKPGVHFLEIGCGSGALSLLAASQGCSVHACDINPMAVACTRALLTSHNVRGEVREGGPGPSEDGDPRQWGGDRLYDVVAWNLPYLPLPQEGPYLGPMEEAALVDSDALGLYKRFLNLVKNGFLLRMSGVAYLVVSNRKDGRFACERAWSKGLAARVIETARFEDGEHILVLQIWHPFASGKVTKHTEVTSTNEVLLASNEPVGTSIISERQTEGRGRRGRSWVTHPGALLSSWVVANAADAIHSPADQLRVGADITRLARFLLQEDARHDVCLKWPNDVYLHTTDAGRWRKAGGVLFEGRSQGSQSAIVLGVGLNLKQPPEREHAGLAEAGITLKPGDLHLMLHGLVASMVEQRGLAGSTEMVRQRVEEEVMLGMKALGDVLYRKKKIVATGVSRDGALQISGGVEVDEPEDLTWSNI